MVAYAWGRGAVRIGTLLFVTGWLVGCSTTEGGPDRLYSVDEEVVQARSMLPGLQTQYDGALSDPDRMFWRNEYIARRMYVTDVEYSAYEAALTSERQKFQFASSVAGQGLNAAGALFTPAATTKILSGIAGGISATKGFYDSDLVIAKTLQIAEGQMRARRDEVAIRIFKKRTETAVTYPLSAALTDLEDYYRAGTLNSGLIEAAGEAGKAAQVAASEKARVVVGYGLPTDADARALREYWAPGGVVNSEHRIKLEGLLKELNIKMPLYAVVSIPQYTNERKRLATAARARQLIK